MKAIVFKKEADSNLLDVEIPKINKDQILLKINSCGICGSDIKFEDGTSAKINEEGKIRSMNYPIIGGHELSGIAVEVGENISMYKTGDRINVMPNLPCGRCYYCQIGHHEMCDDEKVIGYDYNGAFAEYMVVPERAIHINGINKLSEKVTFEEATFIEPVAVSINAQSRSCIDINDTVLIIGAGSIGCINIQLAKVNGAKKVIVAQRSKKKLQFAKKFNADVYICVLEEDLLERVKDETDGKGVDKILLCCGSKEVQELSLDMIKKLGTINYFASVSKNDPYINLNSNLIHYKEIKTIGSHNSTPLQNSLAYELIENGSINVKDLVTDIFALEDYYEAIKTAKSGKGMKVIINPADYN